MDFNKRNSLDLAVFSDRVLAKSVFQPLVVSVAYKIKIKECDF